MTSRDPLEINFHSHLFQISYRRKSINRVPDYWDVILIRWCRKAKKDASKLYTLFSQSCLWLVYKILSKNITSLNVLLNLKVFVKENKHAVYIIQKTNEGHIIRCKWFCLLFAYDVQQEYTATKFNAKTI